MIFMPFFMIVLSAAILITVGLLGSTRRLGFWLAVLLGVVLTPLGGFLVALVSGPRQPRRARRRKARP
jgi:UPF0716 family protein affecting phage T7 exclusion